MSLYNTFLLVSRVIEQVMAGNDFIATIHFWSIFHDIFARVNDTYDAIFDCVVQPNKMLFRRFTSSQFGKLFTFSNANSKYFRDARYIVAGSITCEHIRHRKW